MSITQAGLKTLIGSIVMTALLGGILGFFYGVVWIRENISWATEAWEAFVALFFFILLVALCYYVGGMVKNIYDGR